MQLHLQKVSTVEDAHEKAQHQNSLKTTSNMTDAIFALYYGNTMFVIYLLHGMSKLELQPEFWNSHAHAHLFGDV